MRYPNFINHYENLEHDEVTIGEKKVKVKGFEYFTSDGKITPEGKNFFLSFFLVKGEMSRFLGKRRGCKRNDATKYKVKHHILSFYCTKDSSSRFFLKAKENFVTKKGALERQSNSILNYLKSQHIVHKKYLPETPKPQIEDIPSTQEKKENATTIENNDQWKVRRQDKFAQFIIRYLMDYQKIKDNTVKQKIFWYVKDYTQQEKVTENNTHNRKDKRNFSRKKHYRALHLWEHEYKQNHIPVIKNGHVKFKIGFVDPKTKHTKVEPFVYVMNIKELRNLTYFLLNYGQLTRIIARIRKYGDQYTSAMNDLVKHKKIDFEKYPYAFPKNAKQKPPQGLSSMHLNILNEVNFDIQEYRKRISKAIDRHITLCDVHLSEEYIATNNRHRLNRNALKAFQWFITKSEDKLSPREVEEFSKYIYLKDEYLANKLSKHAHESILQKINKKIEKASHEAIKLLKRKNSFTEYYLDILTLYKQALLHEKKHLEMLHIGRLHKLSGKLDVSLPGIDVSKDRYKDRFQQLRKTIKAKPILVRNGFFRYMYDENNIPNKPIAQCVLQNENWQNTLIDEYYRLENQYDYILCESMPNNKLIEGWEEKEKNALRSLLKTCFEKKENNKSFTDLKSKEYNKDKSILLARNTEDTLKKVFKESLKHAHAIRSLLAVVQTNFEEIISKPENHVKKNKDVKGSSISLIKEQLYLRLDTNTIDVIGKDKCLDHLYYAYNYYRKLKDIKSYDTLLAEIFFQYLGKEGLFAKENKGNRNINLYQDIEYELPIKGKEGIKIPYKHLDDLSTYWVKNDLSKEIQKGKLSLLFSADNKYYNHKIWYNEDELPNKQVINRLLNKIWEESYWYILNFLKIEKHIIESNDIEELIQKSMEGETKGLNRITPRVLLDKIQFKEGDNSKEQCIVFRNCAFHVNIPLKERYDEVQEKLCDALKIKPTTWKTIQESKNKQDEKNEPKQR